MTEERYQILKNAIDSGEIQVDVEKGIVIGVTTKTNTGGYQYFRIHKQYYLVHQAVMIAGGYNLTGKLVVNHKDLNQKNNQISNLELVTQKENVRHAFSERASAKKRSVPRNRIQEVIDRFNKGEKMYNLAYEFGCSYSTISRVVRGLLS